MAVSTIEIGRRIIFFRTLQRLRQVDLARAAGVSRDTITEIEAGRPAMMATLLKICEALGVESSALFGDVSDKTAAQPMKNARVESVAFPSPIQTQPLQRVHCPGLQTRHGV